jgi:hypothetical protein
MILIIHFSLETHLCNTQLFIDVTVKIFLKSRVVHSVAPQSGEIKRKIEMVSKEL